MRKAIVVLVAALIAFAVQGWNTVKGGPAGVDLEGTYQPGEPIDLQALLAGVKVMPSRPSVAGYERECSPGAGCVFGQAWSDDVDVEGGHNGCDTRNDMLRASLSEVHLRPNTNGCVVEAGILADPYTGHRIEFRKTDALAVQVDHLYPLSRSWDMGAHAWTPERRRDFANDPRNLIVADGSANASKGDQGPGEWLPINQGYRCAYVASYLEVARSYDLPITRSEEQTVLELAPICAHHQGDEKRSSPSS